MYKFIQNLTQIKHVLYRDNDTNARQNFIRTATPIKNDNFTKPMDTSLRLNELKSRTIGLNRNSSSASYNPNTVNTAIQRARSSGYIVPKKVTNKPLKN